MDACSLFQAGEREFIEITQSFFGLLFLFERDSVRKGERETETERES